MSEKGQHDQMALLLMIWRKVQVKKNDMNERIDEGKQAECPDGTPPDDVEEGVSERNNDKNKKIDEGKNEGETTYSDSTTMD